MELNPKKSFRVGIFCYILFGALLPALTILIIFSQYLTANLHAELKNHVERMQKVAAADVEQLIAKFKFNIGEQSKADFVAALLGANEDVGDSLERLALHLKQAAHVETASLYTSNGVRVASTDPDLLGTHLDLDFLDQIEAKKEDRIPVFVQISTAKNVGFRVDAYAPTTEPFYKYLMGILHEHIFIDRHFIAELKDKTGLEIALFIEEEAFVYTTVIMPRLDVETYRRLMETKEVITQNSLVIDHIAYHTVLIPLLGEDGSVRGAIGLLGSEEVIEQSKAFILEISLVALLSIIVLSFLMSHISTRRVIKPIMKVVDSLRKTATGDLSQRIEVTSQNEIGELADSFNKMTEDLQHSSEELITMKDYTDNIVKSMVDTLIVVNPEGVIETVNQAAVELLGYTEEELKGKALQEIIDDKSIVSENFQQSLSAGFVINYELTYETQVGVRVPMLFSGSAMKSKAGEIEGIVCIARDITARKEIEEEAKRIQGKLIHANKMTSLGTMVSGVAHEINNPNNVLMFNAPLIAEAWQDALPILNEYHQMNGEFSLGGIPFQEMRALLPDLCSAMSDSSNRIKNIVGNLKNFARQDQMGMDNIININKVIKAAIDLISNQITKSTQYFSLHCEEGLPSIKGNAQQLEQVMINLIINALQSLPDKKCSVSVSTVRDNKGEMITIKVCDEGCGMTEEVSERIMEPFYTTRLDSGGTGLGLSISYSIIKAHQGTIEYQSEVGKGTRVSITLPVGKEKEHFKEKNEEKNSDI